MIGWRSTLHLRPNHLLRAVFVSLLIVGTSTLVILGETTHKSSSYFLKLLVWSDSEVKVDTQVVVLETLNTQTQERHFSSFDRRDMGMINRCWCNSSLFPSYPPSFKELATMKPTRIDLAGNPQAAAVLNSLPPHEIAYEDGFACNSKSRLTAYATVITAVDTNVTPEERLREEMAIGWTDPKGLVSILTLVDQQSKAITYVDTLHLTEFVDNVKDPAAAFDTSGFVFYYGKDEATWKFDVHTGVRTKVSSEGCPAVAWNTGTLLIFSQQRHELMILSKDGTIVKRLNGIDLQVPILTVFQIDSLSFAIGSYIAVDEGIQSMEISTIDFSRSEFQKIWRARSDGIILEAARLP